ncbi:MAG: glycosyltransferase family 4 protein [Acidobacteriota bacterium]|nr:glycosyltransferase family 4 protein [Acidobacteriota bacterium]
MRVLIFHGYLLSGTGSNVYTARLCEALVALGHEVHLLSQDRRAAGRPFVDAVGEWGSDGLTVRTVREPVRLTAYRPEIGPLLPVYVADRYEGVEARTFLACTDGEVERYLAANVRAVREVCERVDPEVALANHLVMGPVILSRALGGTVPYAVKIHGSALEYTVKAAPERFLGLAREGLRGANAILVGSAHTARSLWDALQDEAVRGRTRLGPPGVDTALFRPIEEHGPAALGRGPTARRLLAELCERLEGEARCADAQATGAAGTARRGDGDSFERDPLAAAGTVAEMEAAVADRDGPVVAFVGKLIVSKGVDLLLAAWPLVLQEAPDATLAIVGFGAFRGAADELAGALGAGDLDRACQLASLGRRLEGAGEAEPLRYLLAFLADLGGERLERYARAARSMGERVRFCGRLDHEELALLLPVCEAVVVPSTFPESFGMIAAEAAACGSLPVSAAHSGLAEVSEALGATLAPEVRGLLGFPLGERAVPAIAERVLAWLGAEEEVRRSTRDALVAAVREQLSWEGVARAVIAGASGRLEALRAP